jgi:hypothetical protein
MSTTRNFTFLSNVTLGRALFERGKTYQLTDEVVNQILPESFVEVPQDLLDEDQKRKEEAQAALDRANALNRGKPIVMGEAHMNQAALESIVDPKTNVSKIEVVDDAEAETGKPETADEHKGRNFKAGIKTK